jgi:23S rRNA (uracil1939-C5)-methyltransferase
MVMTGQTLCLHVEQPAVGGRMIARVDGQVVFVGGAIPGERVTAIVERVAKGLAYADTVSVDEPSPSRRQAAGDPACGGCLYAHIAYDRQLQIKALVVADAFARIGRITLPSAVPVAASPEEGYRMRARLHVRGGRIGFYREGSHALCDPRPTRQLLPATCDVLDRMSAALRSPGADLVRAVDLSENVDASERVVHLETAAPVDPRTLARLATGEGLTTAPFVTDTVVVDGRPVSLRRHVRAFFQGNRYLLRDLVSHVVAQLGDDGSMIDLYAGVGLFSVAAATVRSARVVAVEGDWHAAADLSANTQAVSGSVASVHQSVEAFLSRTPATDATLVVDPPRTGLSREAVEELIRLRPPRIIYVSCDVATLARDIRRLVDAGYGIEKIDAFDMFPNTPHVETVVVLNRSSARS